MKSSIAIGALAVIGLSACTHVDPAPPPPATPMPIDPIITPAPPPPAAAPDTGPSDDMDDLLEGGGERVTE